MKRFLGALVQIPLAFEAAPDASAYLARGAAAEITVRCDAIDVALGAERLRIAVEGARSEARPETVGAPTGRVHHLIGRDPAAWRRNVPLHARLRCEDVRPGVDLVYHGHDRQLEFDLVVESEAVLAGVTLTLSGAEQETLTAEGDVVLTSGARELRLRRPVTYQELGGERRPVESRFVRHTPGRLGFAVGPHDPSAPLVVDPVLELSTYAGGARSDSANAVVVDDAGFVIVAGSTDSNDFPTTPGTFQPEYAGANDDVFDRGDAFVMKLAPGGASLVWATYLGGKDTDGANGLALAPGGDVILVGLTESNDFPVTPGVFQPERNKSAPDAFAARLSPGGDMLVYSTYLGGKSFDRAFDVAADDDGNATLVGITFSNDFPVTPGAYQPERNGTQDAFVTRLAPDGASLLWSTYLGGKKTAQAFGVALGADGAAVVAGGSQASSFPTTDDSFQPKYAGEGDAFVTRLAPDGRSLEWSTFLGGSRDKFVAFDLANDVALDADENAVVVGVTLSKDFPVTPDAFIVECGGNGSCSNTDGFVAKLSPDGCALLYGTYLGDVDADDARSVALDDRGHAHVVGGTRSNKFPVTEDAFQPDRNAASDAYLVELDAGGRREVYGTFLGSNNDDAANGVAVSGDLVTQLVGTAGGNDFPIEGTAFQTEREGDFDAFVSVFEGTPAVEPSLRASLASTPNPTIEGAAVTTTLTVSNVGSAAAANVAASLTLDPSLAFDSATPSQGACGFAAPVLTCELGSLAPDATATVEVALEPLASGSLLQTAEVSASGADTVPAALCIQTDAHDFAVLKVKAPKSVRIPAEGTATASVSVEIQNRSPHPETIPDGDTLADLVTLAVTPTGVGCSAASVALDPKSTSKLPLDLDSKKKLKVSFEVTFDCAATDYVATAQVDHSALDGLADSHPVDDACPRAPTGEDPNPDGSIDDKGCGAKQEDGTLGADIVIDAVAD